MSYDQLQFIDYSKPKQNEREKTTPETSKQRIRISANQVFSHYPPPNVSGDFSSVIPHICLNEGQLPWDRQIVSQKRGVKAGYPWLYLLLVNENDIAIGDAKRPISRDLTTLSHDCYFSSSQLAALQQTPIEAENCCVTIDVRKSLLNELITHRLAILAQLAHVRRRWQIATHGWTCKTISRAALDTLGSAMLFDIKQTLGLDDTVRSFNVVTPGKSWLAIDTEHGESLIELDYQTKKEAVLRRMSIKRELSVLMANRFCQQDLTQANKSLRHYAIVVSLEHFFDDENDFKQVNDEQYIRLIGLHYWQFDCNKRLVDFSKQTQGLTIDSMHLTRNASLDKVPQVPSWYHGPLMPFDIQDSYELKAKQSWETPSMEPCEHDKGYQIAFELGRFLSLHNKGFRKALAKYHRVIERSRQFIKKHDNVKNTVLTIDPMTDQFNLIEQWFLTLAQFKQIPTWYFIPDGSLIPFDGIKLFSIDGQWIQNLWRGALSIHGSFDINDNLFYSVYHSLFSHLPKYGAIIRGDVINTYPELIFSVDCRDGKNCQLVEQPLAFDSRMYLSRHPFNGITLALPPECFHYGAQFYVEQGQGIYRKLLSERGKQLAPFNLKLSHKQKAIFDPLIISQQIAHELQLENVNKRLKSAKFGRLMTAGEPRVTLNLQANDY